MNKYHLQLITNKGMTAEVIVESESIITVYGNSYQFTNKFDEEDMSKAEIVACYPVHCTIITRVEREG